MLLLALSFSVVSSAIFIGTDEPIIESPYALPIPTIDIVDFYSSSHFKSNQTSLTLTSEVSEAIFDYVDAGRSGYINETYNSGYLVASPILNISGTESWNEYIYYGNRPTFSSDPNQALAGYGLSFSLYDVGGYSEYSVNLNFNRIARSPTYSDGYSFIYQDYMADDIIRCVVSGTAYTVRDGGVVTSNDFSVELTEELQDVGAIPIDYIIDNTIGEYTFYDVNIYVEYEGQGYNYGPDFAILYDVTAHYLDDVYSVYCPSFISYEANALTFPTPVSYSDFNLLDWLGTAVEGFISTPLFIVGSVTVTIGGLLGLVFGFWIFIAFIKKFAGG